MALFRKFFEAAPFRVRLFFECDECTQNEGEFRMFENYLSQSEFVFKKSEAIRKTFSRLYSLKEIDWMKVFRHSYMRK